MNQCQTEGHYRVEIEEYGLREAQSGAIAISLKAKILECWCGDDGWVQWASKEETVDGDIWIVKKDGITTHDKSVESLAKYAGWDGDLGSVVTGKWQPIKCQVLVKREEYEGRSIYKIAFLNDWNREPGGMGNVTAARALQLQEKFGRGLKAVAGQCVTAAPLPVGASSDPDGDIPF